MPRCRDCHRFDETKKICTVEGGSPGRKCVVASLEVRLRDIKNKQVCEIGPGTWGFAKELLEKNGNTWFGIEPKPTDYRGIPTVRTHGGTASEMPLEDASMDVVLSNQSMEHWHEFETTFRAGLGEIYRVLKPGGIAILNVPIHRHGHPIFIRGDLKGVQSLFTKWRWSDVKFEEWRREFEPLERWDGWSGAAKLPDSMIPNAATASTWILELIATKAEKSDPVWTQELPSWWIDKKTTWVEQLKRLRIRLNIGNRVRRLLRRQ